MNKKLPLSILFLLLWISTSLFAISNKRVDKPTKILKNKAFRKFSSLDKFDKLGETY